MVDRAGPAAVGDAAAELVDQVDADQDRELAPQHPPILWEARLPIGGQDTRHETFDCNPALSRQPEEDGDDLPQTARKQTVAAAGPPPRAGDPRTAAGDVRGAGQPAEPAADRRAGADDPVPAHERPQQRAGLRRAAGALPRPGTKSATRRSPRSRTRSGRAAWRSRRRRGSRRSCANWARSPTSTGPRRRRSRSRAPTSSRCRGWGAKRRPACCSSAGGCPRSRSTSTSTGSAGGSASSREKASLERAHDEMLALVPPADVYEFHLNLIRHGRTICRPKPRCGECELRRMCPWYRDLDHRESVAGLTTPPPGVPGVSIRAASP